MDGECRHRRIEVIIGERERLGNGIHCGHETGGSLMPMLADGSPLSPHDPWARSCPRPPRRSRPIGHRSASHTASAIRGSGRRIAVRLADHAIVGVARTSITTSLGLADRFDLGMTASNGLRHEEEPRSLRCPSGHSVDNPQQTTARIAPDVHIQPASREMAYFKKTHFAYSPTAMSAKREKWPWNATVIVSVGPLRCLATIRSASPARGLSFSYADSRCRAPPCPRPARSSPTRGDRTAPASCPPAAPDHGSAAKRDHRNLQLLREQLERARELATSC